MEIECPHCKNVIRLNIHPTEMAIVLLMVGSITAFAAFGYWLQSRGLMLAAFGAAMAGALALPALERIFLRSWPRYASNDQRPDP